MIAIVMMATWFVVAVSGFLLFLAPERQRSGQEALLFGWRKTDWGEWHTWFSFAASGITLPHLVVDWRAFEGPLSAWSAVTRPGSRSDEGCAVGARGSAGDGIGAPHGVL